MKSYAVADFLFSQVNVINNPFLFLIQTLSFCIYDYTRKGHIALNLNNLTCKPNKVANNSFFTASFDIHILHDFVLPTHII